MDNSRHEQGCSKGGYEADEAEAERAPAPDIAHGHSQSSHLQRFLHFAVHYHGDRGNRVKNQSADKYAESNFSIQCREVHQKNPKLLIFTINVKYPNEVKKKLVQVISTAL